MDESGFFYLSASLKRFLMLGTYKIGCFLFFFWLMGCTADNSTVSAPKPARSFTPTEEGDVASFTVGVDGLRLRETEGPQGVVMRTLEKGERLYDLGEVSDFTTSINLRGIDFNEPWIFVRTERNEQGWVYGGALNPGMEADEQAFNLLLEKRLITFLGRVLARDLLEYRKQYQGALTDDDLLRSYTRGAALRDSMALVLEQKISVDYEAGLPDLFWLERAFPGFIPALVAEGTVYYLFADYHKWLERASLTSGEKDDAFVDLAIQFFPDDSVEYFYPAYFLQTWDYGGHSLLGRGTHLALLEALEAHFTGGQGPIDPVLEKWKQGIIDDITFPENTYWESIEDIRREMTAILRKEWTLLSKEDRVALEVRQKQFSDPESFNISTNHGTGLSQ